TGGLHCEVGWQAQCGWGGVHHCHSEAAPGRVPSLIRGRAVDARGTQRERGAGGGRATHAAHCVAIRVSGCRGVGHDGTAGAGRIAPTARAASGGAAARTGSPRRRRPPATGAAALGPAGAAISLNGAVKDAVPAGVAAGVAAVAAAAAEGGPTTTAARDKESV